MSRQMNILIVGGGKPVYFLTRDFSSKGHRVTIVNHDREECRRLTRKLPATVVHGEGSDPGVLKEAGASAADVVLAVTPHDETNLVICQLAELSYKVPRTLALVNDPEHETVFQKLGVTTAFSITQILVAMIEQRVSYREIVSMLPVGEGKVNLTEVVLDSGAPAAGKTLMEIGLPEDCLVAVILRDDRPLIPRGATMLKQQDRLVLMTLPENHREAIRLLTGTTG